MKKMITMTLLAATVIVGTLGFADCMMTEKVSKSTELVEIKSKEKLFDSKDHYRCFVDVELDNGDIEKIRIPNDEYNFMHEGIIKEVDVTTYSTPIFNHTRKTYTM